MALYAHNKRSRKRYTNNRKKAYKNKQVDTLVDQAIGQMKAAQDQQKFFAQGIAVHTNVNRRTSTNVLENVNDLQNPDLEDRLKMVDLCRKLRQSEGICGSVADLLVDFGITRGSFYSDNTELKSILNKWAAFVNSTVELSKYKGLVFPTPGLRALSRKIFDDYVVDGDSIFTLYWQNGVKMSIDGDALFLPTSIRVLDTLALEIDPDLARFGVERITLKLDDKVIERITKPENEADKFLKDNLPKEWLKFIAAGDDIVLDPNVTFHVSRNDKDYEAWGQSYFIKAFSAVAAKRRLQAVDDATIDGLINRFTIFKLGLEDREKNPAYHIPSSARVAALVNILTDPKRSNAAVWPGPDLDYIDIGPDGKVLEFDQKYKQADKDILRSLHVSPLLIDGTTTGAAADDFISFLSTEVGLDAVRSELEATFGIIGREIAIANNLQYEELYYRFDTQLLNDQERVKNFAIKVFELGGLSVETFVKTMGYNFDTEKQLKEQEESDGTTELFVNPNIPGFTGVAPTGTPEGDDPEQPADKDGRPKNEPEEAAQNPLDNVTLYYSTYRQTFDRIKHDIELKYKLRPDDIGSMQMTLVSGFSQFRMLVEAQLRDIYSKESGGNVTADLQALIAWNDKYIDNFYTQLRDELSSNPAEIAKIFESNEYRVYLYATESYRKATWVGRITRARLEGFSRGIWVCKNEDSPCFINDGIAFDFEYLVENFPGHPNCECVLEFQ